MSDLSDVTRKLVAVFAADVEGYSRLMGADEVGTLRGLTERRAILDRIIGEHRGRIANTAGDSVLAEFGSAMEMTMRLFFLLMTALLFTAEAHAAGQACRSSYIARPYRECRHPSHGPQFFLRRSEACSPESYRTCRASTHVTFMHLYDWNAADEPTSSSYRLFYPYIGQNNSSELIASYDDDRLGCLRK